MSSYTAINRPIEHGERVEVGDLKQSEVSFRTGDEAYLNGVEDASEGRETYVVVAVDLDDGGEVSVPNSAIVLGLAERKRNAASLWLLNPVEVYQ